MLQLIPGLLAISSIGALLALLLEIAGKYLADYGERKIRINEKEELTVQGGNSLLSALMDNAIFIPSACGGKGTCAYCKVKVHTGGGPVLPTETPYLSTDEIDAGTRLSCQVKVKADLAIEIPDSLFLVKEFKVRIETVKELTPDIRSILLKIMTPEEGMAFTPGQYVQLQIPGYKLSKEPTFRAYSISSSSANPTHIELVITQVPDGVVSTYVHSYLKEGDEMHVIGPFGEFYLRESNRNLLFIATGSGLAPIMSILYDMEEKEIQRSATLFFGDRKPVDLYYTDRLRQMEQSMPDFTYIPTLSRVTASDDWDGERGRVTDLIEKHIPDNAPIDVYICGVPAMIQSCIELLVKKGIPEEHIFYDKFE